MSLSRSVRGWLGLALGVALLPGCGILGDSAGIGGAGERGPNTVTINDIRFRSRLDIDGPDRRDLTITVRPVRVDPEAAQEAGRYRATVYCLRRFGSSNAEWSVGPDIPVDQLRISSDDSITLKGRCAAR